MILVSVCVSLIAFELIAWFWANVTEVGGEQDNWPATNFKEIRSCIEESEMESLLQECSYSLRLFIH